MLLSTMINNPYHFTQTHEPRLQLQNQHRYQPQPQLEIGPPSRSLLPWEYVDANMVSQTPTMSGMDLVRWDGLELENYGINIEAVDVAETQERAPNRTLPPLKSQGLNLVNFASPLPLGEPAPPASNSHQPIYEPVMTTSISIPHLSADAVAAAVAIENAAHHATSNTKSPPRERNKTQGGNNNSNNNNSNKTAPKPLQGAIRKSQPLTSSMTSGFGPSSSSTAPLGVDHFEGLDLTPANAGLVRNMGPEDRALVLIKRKIRNRQSAKRSRQRRLQVVGELLDTVSLLRQESERIKQTCMRVVEENGRLKSQLAFSREYQ
mmetsp:Transcript_14451/g.24907  ORF Transcript_14451/g.24907 Transcript_14451/m.24907 type:complete len:320 (+) Transcript_14451:280-1239(+)